MTPFLKNEFKSCDFRHLLHTPKDGNIFKKLSIFSAFSVSPEEVVCSTLAWSPSTAFYKTLSVAEPFIVLAIAFRII